MKRTLPPFDVLLPRFGSAFLYAALFLLVVALTTHTAQAQVALDTFDDGDVSNVFTFSETGGGIGVGTTEGQDGAADAALSVGILPAEAGSFAGFGIPSGEGTTDVSSTSYLTFYFRPTTVTAANLPLTLEINLHEDTNGDGAYDGNVEDEYQAIYHVDTGEGYSLVQIPLASFGDDNAVFPGSDDGFDFSNLLEIVIAIGGPTGPEFAFAIDDVVFREGPVALAGEVMEFDFFDDSDVSDVFTFSETGGGIGVGTTEGQDGAADAALSVGILPAEAGSFAGIVITGGEGTTDASEGVYLRFLFRPTTVTSANLPLTLEINLHEDPNGDGTYDGGTEDEYQAIYHVDTGEGYSEVLIPLASFSDDNSVFAGADDGFDFSSLFEIVIAIGSPTGPEFAFAIDDVGFYDTAATTPVSVEPGSELPASYTLTNAYPNPFNPQTQFELTLVRPQHVRVEVFDLLGRQMALLHEGLLAPQTRHTFQIDASGWPSGLYLYRVTGEAFTDVRSIVLLK